VADVQNLSRSSEPCCARGGCRAGEIGDRILHASRPHLFRRAEPIEVFSLNHEAREVLVIARRLMDRRCLEVHDDTIGRKLGAPTLFLGLRWQIIIKRDETHAEHRLSLCRNLVQFGGDVWLVLGCVGAQRAGPVLGAERIVSILL
jgi:hypothetical protein